MGAHTCVSFGFRLVVARGSNTGVDIGDRRQHREIARALRGAPRRQSQAERGDERSAVGAREQGGGAQAEERQASARCEGSWEV